MSWATPTIWKGLLSSAKPPRPSCPLTTSCGASGQNHFVKTTHKTTKKPKNIINNIGYSRTAAGWHEVKEMRNIGLSFWVEPVGNPSTPLVAATVFNGRMHVVFTAKNVGNMLCLSHVAFIEERCHLGLDSDANIAGRRREGPRSSSGVPPGTSLHMLIFSQKNEVMDSARTFTTEKQPPPRSGRR